MNGHGDLAVRVVFFPGLFLDRRCWQNVASLLPPNIVSEFADRPALDDFRDPLAALSACEADALTRVNDAARSGPVVLAGVSYGAYLSARVASLVPEKVAHVVAVSGLARVPNELGAAFLAMAEQIESGALAFVDVLASLRASSLSSAERSAEIDGLLDDMLALATRESTIASLRMTAALAQPALAIRPFATPMTVVHGRGDQMVPLASGEELATVGQLTSFIVLESGSHLLPMTLPGEVARWIVDGASAPRTN